MCEEMTDNQGDWYLISRDEKVGWGWVGGLGGVGLESWVVAWAHRANGRGRNDSE